jgi:hypothetical protein
MDPSTINDLTKILQSGGNVAAMVAIYLGFKVLEVVKKFFEQVQQALDDTVKTNKRVIELLEDQARAPANRRLTDLKEGRR